MADNLSEGRAHVLPGANEVIYILDLEASSLGDTSFPIEIAWIDHEGRGEQHLIRPAPAWLGADGKPLDWDPEAEKLHGIHFVMLIEQGIPLEDVACRAAEVLGEPGAEIYSDAPGPDGYWVGRLLLAARVYLPVPVRDVRRLYGAACRDLRQLVPTCGATRDRAQQRIANLAREIVDRAEEAEHVRPGIRHRALADAQALWRTWKAIEASVTGHLAASPPP